MEERPKIMNFIYMLHYLGMKAPGRTLSEQLFKILNNPYHGRRSTLFKNLNNVVKNRTLISSILSNLNNHV